MIMYHITYILALLLIMSMTNSLKSLFLNGLVLGRVVSVNEDSKSALG